MPSGSEYGIAMEIISNLGALGVVFWLVYRTFSHTIPRLSKDFAQAIRESREDFKETLKQQRDDYQAALAEQREFFGVQMTAERQQTKDVIEEVRRRRTSVG